MGAVLICVLRPTSLPQGVVYALRHDSGSLRFSDLVGGLNRRSQRRREQLQRLAAELALGGAAYLAWLQLVEGR